MSTLASSRPLAAARRYEGRAAVVTGASRGIGLAIAQRLLCEGARVCLTGRKADALRQAAAELGYDDRVLTVAGSGDDFEHHTDTVSRTLEAFGRIDLLVNNIGINPSYGKMLDLDHAAVRKLFDVNVLGSLSWTRNVHRAWMAEHGGAVVNVASVAGLRPAHNIGMYGASKAALMHMTQQLAAELAPRTRVNAVAPAVVRTRFAVALFEGREDEVVSSYPLGRLGSPGDVASAVAYLGSEDASWVTGQTLVVDGGLTLGGGV
jgi:NAD(P)-dependent dehydrogenase (short-subunit alcohol dehydrogenase family)